MKPKLFQSCITTTVIWLNGPLTLYPVFYGLLCLYLLYWHHSAGMMENLWLNFLVSPSLNYIGRRCWQEVDIFCHFFFGLLCLKFWPSLFSSVVFGSLSKSLFSFFALYMDWPSGRITECEVYVVACCQSQRADNSFLPGNHTESSITQYAFAHVEDSTRCTNEKRSISAFLINVQHFNMCYYYVDR